MNPFPISNLIREREFDRNQDRSKARFQRNGIDYELTYHPPTENSSMSIDLETSNQIGRTTVWESGECDFEALDAGSRKQLVFRHYQLTDEQEFHQCLANCFLYFRYGKELS